MSVFSYSGKQKYSVAPPPKLLLPAATINRGNDFADFASCRVNVLSLRETVVASAG
jgi:hypothetical protein